MIEARLSIREEPEGKGRPRPFACAFQAVCALRSGGDCAEKPGGSLRLNGIAAVV